MVSFELGRSDALNKGQHDGFDKLEVRLFSDDFPPSKATVLGESVFTVSVFTVSVFAVDGLGVCACVVSGERYGVTG